METQKQKNECLKKKKVDNPYEIWKTPDGSWEWRVLKKWQVDDDKPFARWFCAVKSPFTYGSFEYGDVYVKEIKEHAERVITVEEFEDYDNKIDENEDTCPECGKSTTICDSDCFKPEDEDEIKPHQVDMYGRLCKEGEE